MILITLDTTRADHLSCYGYPRSTTPFLEAVAKRSVVFERAFSPATWTLPSHVSMLSGLDPHEHGCWPTFGHVEVGVPLRSVPADVPLVTDALSKSGYDCLAAVGGPFTSSRYGLLRNVAQAVEPTDSWELSGAELNAWIFEQLDARDAGAPLFLFVNYFDAHAPYAPPEHVAYPFQPPADLELRTIGNLEGRVFDSPEQEREVQRIALEQYDRELYAQDGYLRALWQRLEEKGLLEDALVIITADHGEMFGEQGLFGHGCNPFDPVSRVPLLVYRSGATSARRDSLVSTTAIARTILETANVPGPPYGKDYENLLGDASQSPLPYMENRSIRHWIGAVRSDDYKYAAYLNDVGEGVELGPGITLDLVHNPEEDLAQSLPDGTLEVQRALRGSLSSRVEAWRVAPREYLQPNITDDERRRLEALGYTE